MTRSKGLSDNFAKKRRAARRLRYQQQLLNQDEELPGPSYHLMCFVQNFFMISTNVLVPCRARVNASYLLNMLNSGSMPSPHLGHAWAIILKQPYLTILQFDLNINLHCTFKSSDVPALQILWKSTQRFFRFCAPNIFYQKFKKPLSNALVWI